MPSISPYSKVWLCCVKISLANFLNLGQGLHLPLCPQSVQQNRGFNSCPYELVIMADIQNNLVEKLFLITSENHRLSDYMVFIYDVLVKMKFSDT